MSKYYKMTFVLMAIFVLALIGFGKQKDKVNYLNRDITLSVTGIFAIVIFCSHFFGYIDTSNLSLIDKPLYYFTTKLGQLMVSPFLFFSGYGIYQSYKKNTKTYFQSIPKNRILKVYLMFFVSWIFFAAVAIYFKSDYSMSDYFLSLIGITTIGNSNWYVFVILLLYFISFISFTLFKNEGKLLIFSHFVLMTILYMFLHMFVDGYWWYNTLFCYFFGLVFSFYKEKIDNKLISNKLLPIFFFIINLFSFILLYSFDYFFDLNGFYEVNYLFINFFFCFTIVSFLYNFRVKNKILVFLGLNCFWIYMLQRLPMNIFSKSSLITNNKYIYFGLCIFLTLLFSYFIGKAFNYVWKIIFGKEKSINEKTNINLGIVISYVALAVSIIGSFIVTPRILEILGDVQYGLRSFASSIAMWLTVISTALSASYLRFINKKMKEDSKSIGKMNTLYLKLFSILGILILIVTIVGSLLSYLFKLNFGNYSEEENRIIIIIIFITGINLSIQIATSVFTHYLTFCKDFIFIRGISLFVTFFTLVLELVFVSISKSVISISIVGLFLTIFTSIVTIIYSIKIKKMEFSKESLREDRVLLRSIIVFSLFILLNAIVDQINQQVDITILGVMTNAENVTLYTLSRYFTTYLVSLSIAVSSTYAPKVHEYVRNNDMISLNKLFIYVSKIQLIIVTLIVGGFASCGHSFIYLWLGDSKEYIYYYSLTLLILNIIPLSCNLGIEIQRAMNKHKFRAILYIIFALLNVLISVLFIYFLPDNMAIWGAIFGTIFSLFFGNILILNVYNKVAIGLNMGKYFLNVIKFSVISGSSALPSILLYNYLSDRFSHLVVFLITGVLFVLIFAFLLLMFERDIYKSILIKLKSKVS